MRRIVLSAALLMGGWAQAGALQAGVYNLDPPRKYPSDYAQVNALDPIWRVWMHLGELRAVHDAAKVPPQADTLRAAYAKQLTKLEERQNNGTLSPRDRVNLGACLIRMGRYPKARAVLEESLRVVQPDSSVYFLLLLNLASAYQEEDALLQRAIDLQTQALRSWPKLFPGWNRWESAWYRHAEQCALKLMQLRQREQIRNQGRFANELPPLDELFGKIRFVGPSGQYEAGGIAYEQWQLLPADAEKVVLQLLLWRPLDPRLNWLYGELLNVRGQVDWAYLVLDFCKQLASNRELRQHHQILREAVPVYKELFADSTGSGEDRRKQALLLWSLSPRGALLAPAIGAAANEIGGVATSMDLSILSGGRQPPELRASRGADAPRSGSALPDWRQLTVSFLTGVMVAVLGVLQWQQWRRNRRAASAVSTSTAEHFAPK
jgi:tetratricopeptide (TPR) repeat protein